MLRLSTPLRGDESPRCLYKARTGRAKKNRSSLSADFLCVAREFIPALCCTVLLVFVLAGCGSDAPLAPSSPPPSLFQGVTFGYVRESELNTYLRALARILPDFHLIVDEQAVLFTDWSGGRINTYWTRVYANNLILRIQAYSRNAATIRLTSPELIQLHGQLLKAMQTLEGAIVDFSNAIDQANAKLGQFNLAMDRYTQQLSGLAGQPISFFAQ